MPYLLYNLTIASSVAVVVSYQHLGGQKGDYDIVGINVICSNYCAFFFFPDEENLELISLESWSSNHNIKLKSISLYSTARIDI